MKPAPAPGPVAGAEGPSIWVKIVAWGVAFTFLSGLLYVIIF